jgi:mono/diheme cytochrome c family protein
MSPFASCIAVVVAGSLAASIGQSATAASQDDVARGEYLVAAGACEDCHAPLKPGPGGARPDLGRGLSGHPQQFVLPPAPAAQGPWLTGAAATNTAFWGPWGVSYAVNLTPDPSTGIGSWKVDDFIGAMRTGKHLGVGRPILPPMPWRNVGHLTDADLRAMFAYLMAQPAVQNLVPPPIPPQPKS